MENMLFFARKKITMDKFSSQVKISTNNNIKKVLKVEPRAVINSCDYVNGFISINGKIKASVIFVNLDNKIEHSEMYFDFIEKQALSEALEDIFATDTLEVKSVNFSGIDVICVLEHNICLNGNYKYEIPSKLSEDQSFVIKKTKFNALKYVLSCDDNFVVAEESETNLSNINVMSSSATVILTETASLVDKIAIEGKVIANLVYLDEQGIGQYSKEFEFKQEISANGVLPNMITSALVSVKEITITAEENDGKTNLVFSASLFAKGMVYEEYEYEAIDDMFSLNNVIQTTYDYIDARSFSALKNYTDTFMLSFDVSKIENFDDIMGVYFPKFKISNIEEQDDRCYVNAVISSLALYKSGEEVNEIETELPVKIDVIKDKGQLIGNMWAIPEITSYKVKAGKNLEVVYSLNYNAVFNNSVNLKYLKSYEVQGEKSNETGGIKIYVTQKGETIFDVAKSLNVKPETITSQNNVMDYFEQGEKIYVYSPINLYN